MSSTASGLLPRRRRRGAATFGHPSKQRLCERLQLRAGDGGAEVDLIHEAIDRNVGLGVGGEKRHFSHARRSRNDARAQSGSTPCRSVNAAAAVEEQAIERLNWR